MRLLECFPLRIALGAKTQLPPELTTGMKRSERGPRAQGDSTLRHVRELIFEYTGVPQSLAGMSTPRTRCAPRVKGMSAPDLARPGNSRGLPSGLLFWRFMSVTFKAGCLVV